MRLRKAAWVLLAFAVLDLAVAGWVGAEVERTRSISAEIDARAAELRAGEVLRGVDNLLVRMLAEASAAAGNRDIEALLARNGVRFRVNPRSAAAPELTAPPTAPPTSKP